MYHIDIIKHPAQQLHSLKEYVHFLCTSEDINNLSYALMMTDAKNAVICRELSGIINRFATFAEQVYLIANHLRLPIIQCWVEHMDKLHPPLQWEKRSPTSPIELIPNTNWWEILNSVESWMEQLGTLMPIYLPIQIKIGHTLAKTSLRL